MSKPMVAIIGKPNVGKSTFFNYIVGQRLSIVEDTPGVTRDRIYADSNWRGREFTLIDTGGIEPELDDVIHIGMRQQAQMAINIADVIIFVTDIKQGITAQDQEIATMLRKSKKPIVLVCNKSDNFGEPDPTLYEFYNLGIGEPYPVSSTNALGIGDVLDAVYEHFPEKDENDENKEIINVAIIGKPNVGKSSFFNSATSSSVEMANYPFTTIDANKAVAHVISECPCKELNVTCNPRNSICIDGKRLLPVELIDVAGLVPGAHEGKGLGNQFLDDLMQAKVLIHVIDASGSTDAEGQSVEAGSHDPLDDIEFLEDEIVMWMYGILNRNWVRLVRKIEAEKLDIAKVIFDQLSGTGITLEDIIEAKRKVNPDYTKWEKEDFMELIRNILHIAKPMLIVANKADLPTAEENIKRMQEKYPYVIPASAESEIALVKAAEAGLISYTPGDSDFEILEKDKLSDNQLKALEYIKVNILEKYGGTGIQTALNEAIFGLLNMIVVYPVQDEHKYTDQKGNVLPDGILVPKGAVPKELAYLVHSDIGDNFMHAVDARKNMRIAADYELQDKDVISIVTRG